MIPLKDNIPSKKFPLVNYFIIITCSLVFIYEILQGKLINNFTYSYALIPYNVTHSVENISLVPNRVFIPFLTNIFLHGGWIHLLGNMLYLWIFGDNIEDTMGHILYGIFYLICGFSGNLFHILSSPNSRIPTIGASGAIAGVLGAYLILFPTARILTLVPIMFFWRIIEIPAFFVLGFWFIIQFFNGVAAVNLSTGGIAWWAHIGGFAAGVFFILLTGNRKRYLRRYRRY